MVAENVFEPGQKWQISSSTGPIDLILSPIDSPDYFELFCEAKAVPEVEEIMIVSSYQTKKDLFSSKQYEVGT
jgi:hypothetical protein